MTKYKVPAIVLGMTVNGLGVVRSLARCGIKVYALDSHKERSGMTTRYATCLTSPDVQNAPQEFKDFLLGLVKEIGGSAVILPTSDSHNEFVNNHREELTPHLLFAMPPKVIMDQILNKKGQYLLANKFGIPMPQTHFPANTEEVKGLADRLQYPLILKGISTGGWRKKFGDKKAVIVKNYEELLNSYIAIHNFDHIEPIIQEIIPGDDTRHYKICAYINKQGEPLLTFTLQKIRQYPCDFGIGSSVISAWESKVAELGLRFMREIGYYGVGSIEFKKDSRDNEFKMIELNPRLWAQNSLPDACGQNFALTAYLDILGENLAPKKKFKEGIKWIAFDEDRTSFKGYHRQGRMSWGQWLSSILTGKRVWGTWAWDDPMPFLYAIKFGFLPFLKLANKIKLCNRNNPFKEENFQKDGIRLEITRDFADFQQMRPIWNSLYEKSGIENPFLKHEWLTAWWKGYGQDKELFVVCFKKKDETIGFAPLMKYKTKLTGIPIKTVGFISNHWTRMDFILCDEQQHCIHKLADLLSLKKTVSILAQIDTHSENYTILKQALSRKGIRFSETNKQHAYMLLQGSWQDYIKNQSRNFRMDFNRKLKRLGKIGIVSLKSDTIAERFVLEQIRVISRNSWQSKNGGNIITQKHGETFYNEIIKEWKGQGILDFSVLQVGSIPVSYLIGIKMNNSYFAFDTAYHKDFQKYSPGMVMHNLLLEQLFNKGIERFDFGYIADYKKRWAEQVMMTIDVTIYPPSIMGRIASMGNRIKQLARSRR